MPLKNSEKRYQSLWEILDAGIVVHAADTTVTDCNDKAQELLGLSKDQMLGKQAVDPQWKFLREDGTPLPPGEFPVNLVISSGKVLRNYRIGVNNPRVNRIVWGEINGIPVCDKEGIITEVLISFIDITDQKDAEEALHRSEEKYRTIFENVQDVFYQADLDGIIREISPSVRYYSEFKREELLNRPVMDIYQDPADRNELIKVLSEKGELRDYELKLKTKSGVCRFVSVNARLITDANGKPDHIDGALRDITERKKTEDTLHEKMEELLRFQRLTVGRELAMINLKKEVNELLEKSGQEPRYTITE